MGRVDPTTGEEMEGGLPASYLSCPGCGLPYSRTPIHTIDTLPGSGLVAYCELCNRRLPLGAKKSHITNVINEWRAGGDRPDYDTIWQMALDFADWEHLTPRRRRVV